MHDEPHVHGTGVAVAALLLLSRSRRHGFSIIVMYTNNCSRLRRVLSNDFCRLVDRR
jgi:hypothetical protein